MRYKYISVILLVMCIAGCANSEIDVVVPQASSEELYIRADEYKNTMRKYSIDGNVDNKIYDVTQQQPQHPVANSNIVNANVTDLSVMSNAANGRRMALIIGNSNYLNSGKLSNSINDANAMAKTLKSLGFSVMILVDAKQIEMKKAIDDFGMILKEYDVSLFFYAGHGVQVNGSNYLVPIDAKIESENDVEYNCVHAGRILAKMEDAGCRTNIVILDACRDNPFAKSWTRDISVHGRGLAFMNAPSGSLIAYSTSPGKTALDGEAGKNGVYTSALLKHLLTPNISIEEMFKRVRVTVEAQTNNKQIPWESTSLKGTFVFNAQ